MAHTQSLSLLPRNAHSVPFVELRQSLPSRVAAISPFVDQLLPFILKFRNADGSETDIEMALHEALVNAVMHGNGENPHKRVYFTHALEDAAAELLEPSSVRSQVHRLHCKRLDNPYRFRCWI
jgi:hypothetical protein